MNQRLRALAGWWLAWLVLSAAGAAWLARNELRQLQEAFETDARIAHRLLSQQVVQYDAVLATLALLGKAGAADSPEQRLPSVYPSILSVQRRERSGAWPDAALAEAEAQSRNQHRPALAQVEFARGRYRLVIGAEPVSYALDIDLAATVPWRDWPMDPKTSPSRVTIEQGAQQFVVQPGRVGADGWRFDFRKVLASESQAFDVVARRDVAWRELPWILMAAWALAVGVVLGGARMLLRQREARRRAEELLRLGQVARLNALGELAAGMAHELNQPLTALLANTQAARRLLADDPPDIGTARDAMGKASEQARRAADVVARLRRAIERPDGHGKREQVALQDAARSALYLLEPECTRRGVGVNFEPGAAVRVLADPVALEQIVHNLLINALQALDTIPAGRRRITIEVLDQGPMGQLVVSDSGPGIAAEALPRLFEPFYSTREGGLGLGLSLSESLAGDMGGSLAVDASATSGARFVLSLPLAGASA
ncbi:ATP-binding protein [Variovorax sp. dw_308]|uniref:sensor histidine kinase n=1 Tax=Variovorax sp. dw_308 TaxID=2721546 RepID=UPI001BD24A54|nr:MULTISPECIES: ATP-binding protein [unclassified Variovorax]